VGFLLAGSGKIMHKSRPSTRMTRRMSLAAGAAVLALLSGLTLGLPVASAKSVTVVSMPKDAGLAASAPGYSPATITVVIGINNTVTWTNNDTVAHTVTPSNEPAGNPWTVGSGNMDPKAAYSFAFTVPGTYTYGCAYHSTMAGTIVVKPGVTTTPEFPAASLAAILFAVIAVLVLAAPRLRTSRMGPQAA
jgi:plastocyanin